MNRAFGKLKEGEANTLSFKGLLTMLLEQVGTVAQGNQ